MTLNQYIAKLSKTSSSAIVILFMAMGLGLTHAQSTAHFTTDISLNLPTGDFRVKSNDNYALPGFGFGLAYFAPFGRSSLGINSTFTGVFNRHNNFKSTNANLFKVSGGWYNHLMMGTGPAYLKSFKNFALKLYGTAGLNFSGISNAEETIIRTGQLIESNNFESDNFFFYEAGIGFILEGKVILGISYLDLGNLTYPVQVEKPNNEPEKNLIQTRGQLINFKIGLLW